MWEAILLRVMLEKSLVEDKNLFSVETTFKDFEVEIGWDITMRCNYTCSYCNSYNNNQPTFFRNINEYKEALIYLKEYLGNKKAKIDILGGEPMLYKKWDSIVNIVGELDFIPNIVTNLSVSNKSLSKKLNNLIPKKCIHVTWHAQFAEKNKLLDNINLIYESGHLDTIAIMADKRYWDKVLDAYESVKHTGVASLAIIKDESSGFNKIASKIIDYTKEELELIKTTERKKEIFFQTTVTTKDSKKYNFDKINDFFNNQITNFKGMTCNIGILNLQIRPNGDIYPSACLMNYPQARMGNIYEKNIKKAIKGIKCPFDFCGCGPDLRINKYA